MCLFKSSEIPPNSSFIYNICKCIAASPIFRQCSKTFKLSPLACQTIENYLI